MSGINILPWHVPEVKNLPDFTTHDHKLQCNKRFPSTEICQHFQMQLWSRGARVCNAHV